jgi:hypothetical protein
MRGVRKAFNDNKYAALQPLNAYQSLLFLRVLLFASVAVITTALLKKEGFDRHSAAEVQHIYYH